MQLFEALSRSPFLYISVRYRPHLYIGLQDLVRELGMVDEDLLLPHLLDGVVVVTLHRVVVLVRKNTYKFAKKYLCNYSPG